MEERYMPHFPAASEEDVPTISITRTSTQASGSANRRPYSAAHKRVHLPQVDTGQKLHRNPAYKTETWKRKHEAELEWHVKWDSQCFNNGRVLIIDYISQDATKSAGIKRHVAVAAVECQSLVELKRFYSEPERVRDAALRVIHVQNASWATPFLLRKFNINHPNEIVGMKGFGRWAQYEKPRQRNGKPFPNGRSWRAQTDPWRNVSRTAFGLDYMKAFPAPPPHQRHRTKVFGDKPVDAKMMSLDAYEDSSNPYGHDVSVQRLSVYVQRNLGPPGRVSPDVEVKSPYAKHNVANPSTEGQSSETQNLAYYDNSNTVIVFETSASMLLDDCLIQPRSEFEKRWRRLSFYLRKDDVLNDTRLAAQCTNIILADVFNGLGVVWDQFLAAASDHVAILEDKIYENPADESRANELWTNQAAWLKVDKVMWIHQDLIREMQDHMRELADADDDDDWSDIEWMSSTPAEYGRLSHLVTEDLVQPTSNLSDLMYKSVEIRDSRQSLQLGLSMWRLSWITFIFLPLTFIVGFFGMNVNAFQNYPNIGWYFLAALLLMIVVLGLWYCVKHSLQRSRQTPYQRGMYEALYTKLEDQYPSLWASTGAVEDIEPVGFYNRIKWRLLKRWFSPEKTVRKQMYSSLAPDDAAAELGAWAGFKRRLLLRWLGQLQHAKRTTDDSIALEEGVAKLSTSEYDGDAISELVKFSTPAAVAEAEPSAVVPMSTYGLQPLHAVERRTVRTSEDRPNSRGSSGIMFEERALSSDSESEAAGSRRPRRASR